MTRPWLWLCAAMALAACGADGPPTPPPAKPAPQAGLMLSGQAAMGVSTQ